MNKRVVWVGLLGVLIGFALGFLLANRLNRNQIQELEAKAGGVESPQPGLAANRSESTLSDKEIQDRLAEARRNAKDFSFQKGLGLALYSYATSKQDSSLLVEVGELLARANSLNPDDYQVIVSLANVNYDLGQIMKDEARNKTARRIYLDALSKNPKDFIVITDVGMTYLFQAVPDPKEAVKHFEKALAINSKFERALEYMTAAQIELGEKDKAGRFLANLKAANPNNSGIREMESKLSRIE